jgi:glyoxylase-like metal-dependent hydrolase (beta-lactamase superfamily II)/8-oxo-dGTP pyrophosphatase MutT (NUDIX family)
MTATNFYEPAADARCAASVLLLRDGAQGLEVLMLRRAERDGDQRSGVAVFPGGVLDARDRAAHAYCEGPSDASMSQQLGLAEGGLDYAVAAVRETFEEVGLLLALGDTSAAAMQTLHPWRERLNRGQDSIAAMCQQHGLRLALRGLVYYSHWLTPPGTPKRFDTRFFMAMAPAHQTAQADLGEAVELMWLTPKQALSKELALKLLPVTRRTLSDLSKHASAESAMTAAQAPRNIPMIMPRRVLLGGKPSVVLPEDLAYAEVGRLDPMGRGDIHADITAGRAVRLSDRVWRVTAPNPGLMTGPGTNSYLVTGVDANEWTVIDPGPDLGPDLGHGGDSHTQALLAAVQAASLGKGRITQILVTHTHRDHSPAAVPLAQATGAPVLGRRAAHPEWQDESFAPQRELLGGERLAIDVGTTLRVVHTPGHASNHLCYLLEEEATLFTGDHVMQGSTVVINPPDGDMAAYLTSLQDLAQQPLQWLAPGHGFLVADPPAVLKALIAHRLKREAKALQHLKPEPNSVAELVKQVYDDVSPALHGMAQRSLLAHLLKLQGEGLALLSPQGLWAGRKS